MVYNIQIKIQEAGIDDQGLSTECWPNAHLIADIDEQSSHQFNGDV